MSVLALYRYEGELRSSYYESPSGSEEFSIETQVNLCVFNVCSETPKGKWINRDGEGKRWISNTSKKRYAYPTKLEAIQSFVKRKERSIKLFKQSIQYAYKYLSKADTITKSLLDCE